MSLITPQIVIAEMVCASPAGRRQVGATAVRTVALLSDSHDAKRYPEYPLQVVTGEVTPQLSPAQMDIVTHLPVD